MPSPTSSCIGCVRGARDRIEDASVEGTPPPHRGGVLDERRLESSAGRGHWTGVQHLLEQYLHLIEHFKGSALNDLRRLCIGSRVHLGNDVVVAGTFLHVRSNNIKYLLHFNMEITLQHNFLSRCHRVPERRCEYINSLI